MTDELADLVREVAAHPPFQELPLPALRALLGQGEIRYHRRGEVIFDAGTPVPHLYWIRSGAVELRRPDSTLELRLAEGEVFGHDSALSGTPSPVRAVAFEDALLLVLPVEAVEEAAGTSDPFERHLRDLPGDRLRAAGRALQGPGRSVASLLTDPVQGLITRSPVAAESELSIREAARLMTREGVSCLPVLRQGGLVGIVTDRDLRSRALAADIPPESPVEEIMSPDPVTLPITSSGFEALLAMTRLGIHHLPLVEGDRLVGVVTATDLIRRERASPIYVVGDVRKAGTAEEVARAAQGRERVFLALVEGGAPPAKVARILTEIMDAVTVRLIEIASRDAAAPPVPWIWLAFGSQARGESGIHSDQDHGTLLLPDGQPGNSMTEPRTVSPLLPGGGPEGRGEETGSWLADMARTVVDGLRQSGYPPCPGEVMATESRWRRTGEAWEARFHDWVFRPTPEALLHAGIFFDFRGIGGTGPEEAVGNLRERVLEATRGNEIFAAHLLTSALRRPPPLGIFRQLVLERDGEGTELLDLKQRGLIPIVDLVRILALESGVPAVATRDRIDGLAGTEFLSPDGGSDLREAFDFIHSVRLQHQARQLARGTTPDSLVPPGELSGLERRHLRDAFRVVHTLRESLENRLQSGLLG
jgi:CBS domain-containing protein